MRVLLVHHGRLPSPGEPVTGGALRAAAHLEALRGAGHEVHCLSRAQDLPGGFASPVDLARRAQALRPDRVVAVQLEDAPALAAAGAPLLVDLYAPRLLEAPFEGLLRVEATRALQALSRADAFLVSNPRQRAAWYGVLALAGFDLRQDPTRLVPLAAPKGPPRTAPAFPRLVAGGVAWPWQEPEPVLSQVAALLGELGGELILCGGAPGEGPGPRPGDPPALQRRGWLGYDESLALYATCTLALDWHQPHPEWRLALGFRHMDHLGCGLPILTAPDSALTDLLGGAGWAREEAAVVPFLRELLSQPEAIRAASEAALQIAADHRPAAISGPLLSWIEAPFRAPRTKGPLSEAAELAARGAGAEARAEAAEAARARAEAEVEHKRQEVARLVGQNQDLLDHIGRLGRALDEGAGFKREAIAVLGGGQDRAARSLIESERERALLLADAAKKTAELQAMDELRARLEHDVENLRHEVARLRQRGPFSRI